MQPTTAAPSVQPTTRTTSAESSKDQPIQRTSSESGDVATGTQVVPLSSAPTSNKTPPPASPHALPAKAALEAELTEVVHEQKGSNQRLKVLTEAFNGLLAKNNGSA